MGNILVFQVRRVGDLFQSVPLIEKLSATRGDKEKDSLDIIIDESVSDISGIFSRGVRLLTYEDVFKSFCGANNVPVNAVSGLSASDFLGFLNKFNPFLSIFVKKYKLAVNLNYDAAASLMASFFNGRGKGPLLLDKSPKNNQSILRSGASNYLFNIVKSRNSNRINIVDIFSLIGTDSPADIKSSYDVIGLKKRKKIRRGAKFKDGIRICVSIGATSIKRIWPTSNYAALINLIEGSLKNCEFTIVGTREEAEAASEIKKNLPESVNVIDLTGKTTLPELVYFIKDFDLIIAPDTGTLHIAQIFDVPSVSIFTGNANFYETGPHVEKSAVIYSRIACYPCFEHEPCRVNYACRNDINPADVFNLALMQLKAGTSDYKDNSDGISRLKKAEADIKSGIKKGNFSAAYCRHAG